MTDLTEYYCINNLLAVTLYIEIYYTKFGSLLNFYFCGEEPHSRCYRHTAALRLIVQTCDEDD
jgi:hypothetical protein